MDECIDRKTLINNLELLARHEDRFRRCVILGVVETIRAMKAADVVPVKHGKWIESANFDTGFWVCSKCGFVSEAIAAPKLYNYCPNCGAKMDGGVE